MGNVERAVEFLQADMPVVAMSVLGCLTRAEVPLSPRDADFIQLLSCNGKLSEKPSYYHEDYLSLYEFLSTRSESEIPRDEWLTGLSLVDLFKTIAYYRREQLSTTVPCSLLADKSGYQHDAKYNPDSRSLFAASLARYTDDKLNNILSGRFKGSSYEIHMQHGLVSLVRVNPLDKNNAGILH